MSYCVNCGVELEKSEAVCPLCDTEVVNPKQPNVDAVRPWPKRVEAVAKRAERLFVAWVSTVVLLAPVLICVINDLMLTGTITWSIYVVAGIVVVYVCGIVPLFFRKPKPELFLLMDALAVLFLLLMIDIRAGGYAWSLPIGLPLIVTLCGFVYFFIWWFGKKGRTLLLTIGLLLYSAGLYTMVVEVIINLVNHMAFWPTWSWYTLIPCAVIGTFFVITDRRSKWKEKMRKRFHF